MRIEDGATSSISPCEGERGSVAIPEQETRLESLVSRNSDASEDGLEDHGDYENSPTHLTAVLDLVATPIPRVDMHLRRVRSPDYFRTQYLSNLGIWTHDCANQRISAEPAGTRLRHYVAPGIGWNGRNDAMCSEFRTLDGAELIFMDPSLDLLEDIASSSVYHGHVMHPSYVRREKVDPEPPTTRASRYHHAVAPPKGEGDEFNDEDELRGHPQPCPEHRPTPSECPEAKGEQQVDLVRPFPPAGRAGLQDAEAGESDELVKTTLDDAARCSFADGVRREEGHGPLVLGPSTAATEVVGLEGEGEKSPRSDAPRSSGEKTGTAGGTCPASSAGQSLGPSPGPGELAVEVVSEEEEGEGTVDTTDAEATSEEVDKISSSRTAGQGRETTGNGHVAKRDTERIAPTQRKPPVESLVSSTAPGDLRLTQQRSESTDAIPTAMPDIVQAIETRRKPAGHEEDLVKSAQTTAEAPPALSPSQDESNRGKQNSQTVYTRAAPLRARDVTGKPTAITLGQTVADPKLPASPPVEATKSLWRRDIRRDYMTNLGMKRAVAAGPGGTSRPPPMYRRTSFVDGSVDHPVSEQLKDASARDVNFEELIKVVGSLFGGGGGKRDAETRRCQICERGDRSRGSNPGGAKSNGDGRGGLGEEKQGEDGSHGGEAETGAASAGLGPCRHKHVEFAPLVSAVYIPVHSEYSDRVRRSYWNSAGEIREMVYRNMIEFDAEEYNWRNVAEEEDMHYCQETGEYIHPIFFEAEGGAGEASAVEPGGTVSEDHLEYINEGRRMPVMQRR